jgi:hypothetical protein
MARVVPCGAEGSSKLASMAGATKHPVQRWTFMPTGEFHVNERDDAAHIGEIFFDDNAIVTGPALQIRDWIFFMMRHAKDWSPISEWIVSAFHADAIHILCEVHGNDQLDARRKFCLHVVQAYWAILVDDYHPKKGDTFSISLKQSFATPAHVQAMIEGYTMRGGVDS